MVLDHVMVLTSVMVLAHVMSPFPWHLFRHRSALVDKAEDDSSVEMTDWSGWWEVRRTKNGHCAKDLDSTMPNNLIHPMILIWWQNNEKKEEKS